MIRFAPIAALASLVTMISAQAQDLPEPLSVQPQIDSFSVDMVNRRVIMGGIGGVSIGQPSAGGLSFSWNFSDDGWRHSALGTLRSEGSTYYVSMGTGSATFTKSGSTFTCDQRDGGRLFEYSTFFTYTDRNGAIYRFDKTLTDGMIGSDDVNEGILTKITQPDGQIINLNWEISPYFGGEAALRLQSITTNLDYQIHLDYAKNSVTSQADFSEWRRIKKATAFDESVESCNKFADTCTFTNDWPNVGYFGANEFQLATVKYTVDSVVQTTTFTHNTHGRLTGMKLPGSSSNDMTWNYSSGASGRVTSVNVAGGTWTYSATDNTSSKKRTVTVNGPHSISRTIESNLGTALNDGRVISDKDGENQKTEYEYDDYGRVTRITLPAGNYVDMDYDDRGNVKETTRVAKTGSGDPNIVTSATFPTTCSNTKTCNKPTKTTDALSKVTDYTYDTTHGGLLSVEFPADDNNKRQKINYTYSNSFLVAVWRPTTITTCSVDPTCASLANQSKTTITYSGPHVLPADTTTGDGAGTLAAVTALTYNDWGDVTAINGPLTGASDSAYFFYDELRRPIGSIGPDPDGAGPLLRPATKTTYTTRGAVSQERQGTATGTSEAAFNAMVELRKTAYGYDGYGRPVKAREIVSGTDYGVVQTAYDDASRVTCTALRLKLSGYPSDACDADTPNMSSYGPDRITKRFYDTAGRVTNVKTAFDTGEVANAATYTYLKNNLVKTITDARGKITDYSYDGHDRRTRTTFADGTSIEVFEVLTYDAASRVTQRRLRDGELIKFTYDARNRLTFMDAPAGLGDDVTYDYDVMGRQLEAAAGGHTDSFVYDMLGRVTSATSLFGGVSRTVSYQYDLAGQRTRMTWPDAEYVTYDYNEIGAVTAIKQSGTDDLVEFTYNDLGQRTALDYGNGLSVTYDYDAAKRLEEIVNDLSGTSNDQTFNYTYNPAGQITSRLSQNANYDYTSLSGVTITSIINSLNQPTSVGAATIVHDARGNLTDDGTTTYTYDIYNRLTGAGLNATFDYDALGRLFEADDGTDARRFLYDGSEIIAEYDDTGTMLHRYVRGPGADEVLVEYDGDGMLPADKTWLHHDERGSVIAGSKNNGAMDFINVYDEFGNPGASNEGSFQYTGQLWLSEAGLYHFKARAYNPDLGRFMQTDPIGYADGLNMYAYVGGDPVGGRDPSGLERCTLGCIAPVVGTRTRYGGSGIGNGSAEGVQVLGTKGTLCCSAGMFDNVAHLDFEKYGIGAGWTALSDIDPGFNKDAFTNPPENTERNPLPGEILIPGVQSAMEFIAQCGSYCSGRANAGFELQVATAPFGTLKLGAVGVFGIVRAGTNFGKLGTAVANPGIAISGFRSHAVNQAITRGVTTPTILNTVRNPSVVLSQSGGKHLFLNQNAAVVLNANGVVVTTYGRTQFDDTILRILAGGT